MIQISSKTDLIGRCVGGILPLVAWLAMYYTINKHYVPNGNLNRQNADRQVNYTDLKEESNNPKSKNNTHSSEYITLLGRRVKSLQSNVVQLEKMNEQLREANRLLTKLANCTSNIGFKKIKDLYNKLEESPQSRDERAIIFMDYPSYEFTLVRPSSNEI